MIHQHAVFATWRRQLMSLLSNPLAYVFILAFVLFCALIMFWDEDFFQRNVADFQPLREYMLYPLSILIPALAMGSWASERELGTEEQLLSLPMSLWDILLGKWLGIASFFTLTLVCSLCNVFELCILGDPDLGLIFAHYVGWWFTGLILISFCILASCLVSLPAIAFVIGAAFCGIMSLVFDATGWLDPFYRGVIPLPSILMTFLLAIIPLAIAVLVLSLRRWQAQHASRFNNMLITCIGFSVFAFNIIVLLDRTAFDVDVTEERLSSLSDASEDVLSGVSDQVEIVAFISQELPNAQLSNKAREVETMLQSIDRSGGSRIDVTIKRPRDVLDELGIEASKHYGLEPKSVIDETIVGRDELEVFMGAFVRSGAKSQRIEYFDPGLSVEFELIRAIRAVSQQDRKVVGVVDTSFKVLGGYDYQARQMRRSWAFVEELKKQHEIREVKLDTQVSPEIDALLVVQLSQLKEEELRHLHDAVWQGTPTLILEDPLPVFSGIQFASSKANEPPRQNPFGQQPPPPEPKAQLHPFMKALGIEYHTHDIMWSSYNPSHDFRDLPKDFVWAYRSQGSIYDSSICTGIDGVLFPGAGSFERTTNENSELTIKPLVSLDKNAAWGEFRFNELIGQSFFGFQRMNPRLRPSYGSPPILAVHVQGKMKRAYDFIVTPESDEKEGPQSDDKEDGGEQGEPSGKGNISDQEINVVLISDTDFIHDQFYSIYRNENGHYSQEGMQVLQGLRNVQFIANAVDALLGDEDFLQLRTRRHTLRPLTLMDEALQEQRAEQIKAENAAIEEKAASIADLKQRMQEKIDKLRASSEDSNAIRQRLRTIQENEERRLQFEMERVNKEFERTVKESKIKMRRAWKSKLREEQLKALGMPSILIILLITIIVYIRSRDLRSATPLERQRSN